MDNENEQMPRPDLWEQKNTYDVLRDTDLLNLITRVNERLNMRGGRWRIVGAVVVYQVDGVAPYYLQTMFRDPV